MQTTKIAEVKYYGPTNTRGSRVKIILPHLQKTLPLNYEFSSAAQQAFDWLNGEGYGPIDIIRHNNQTFITLKTYTL
jgi:hypothetical protein